MFKIKEDWMQKKWRPLMAMQYMAVCACDFIIFPIMFTAVQLIEPSASAETLKQWAPITLQGGGLYHIAMGAVLGITAWSRGQEKLAGATTPVSPYTINSPTGVVSGYNGKPAPIQHYPEI